MTEIHGYVSSMKPKIARKTIVLQISISTLGGEGFEALVHDPPDWLDFGSRVTCSLERIREREGEICVADDLKPSTMLPDTVHVELLVESVRETPDGHVMLEGRREDGGLFSYLLKPENANTTGVSPPYRAVAIKTHQRGIDRVVAVLPLKNYQILKRTKEFILRLKENEEKRPELDFLQEAP
ncbi:MAG: hypothetical protein RMJ28_01555 [Nitrososphaerota archaeon]|nr:hypothetical protein [Candidatus Calditenuaceae archaeon]MDW8072910.1 hypothetical protein [Nitrososphaerota archaeon]